MRTLTLEEVARYPRPGTTGPKKFGFTPDGQAVVYLFSAEGSLVQQLWQYDIKSGQRRQLTGEVIVQPEGTISREEELRRERSRTRELGVTSYKFAGKSDAPVLLIPMGGKLFVSSNDGAFSHSELKELEVSEGALDAALSPDGTQVAFVRDDELCVMSTQGGAVRVLTSGAGNGITNGLAEYVAQEEMGRAEGFWWSRDSSKIAYIRADSRHIAKYPIVHQGKDAVDIEEHRYPFAGTQNATVELGVIDLAETPSSEVQRVRDLRNELVSRLQGILGQQERLVDDEKTKRLVALEFNRLAKDLNLNLTPEQTKPLFDAVYSQLLRLGTAEVTKVAEAHTSWMNLGTEKDIYIARVAWRPDGTLTALIENREQTAIKLLAFNPRTGETIPANATPLIEERGDPWINLDNDLRFLQSGEILFTSEKTGFRHIYLLDQKNEQQALTSGEWIVTNVVALDQKNRMVYFHATRESVTERHLYAVSLDGGEIKKLTDKAGWHETVVAPDFSHFIDEFSSLEQAPSVTLYKIDGTQAAVLYEDKAATAEALGLSVPELTTFQTRDGVTLHAAIYNPPNIEPGKRYPLIVSVYGGPHAQRVMNQWLLTVDLRPQYLAQQGFVVVKVDNRGSANRGLAFEGAIVGDMGRIEVDDQVDGVRFMAQRSYVDGERVGIFGWSYGGYMTLMSMLRAPEVFKVGVAGAPVTHWDGYDTHYTERYMRLPAANADGYRETSPITHADKLQGKLLLVHGMVDENVHFRHTARLIVALTNAQKPYDLLIYPEERHMPRDAKGLEYMERRITAYFEQNL